MIEALKWAINMPEHAVHFSVGYGNSTMHIVNKGNKRILRLIANLSCFHEDA